MLAEAQHGVVARWQLRECGVSADMVAVRIERATLHRVYRGVYAVGRRKLERHGRWIAAVLAAGPDAVISHRTAAALWELRPEPTRGIDVIDPRRRRRSHHDLRIHHTCNLPPHERTVVNGIPVTSVARTLLDYAGAAGFQWLRLALEAAERQDRLDGDALAAVLSASRGRPGAKNLRAALEQMHGPAPWTQSELERAFQALIRDAGLPEPQTNVFVAGELVDCYWPHARLVAECDSWLFHKTRAKFEQDRRKLAKLQVAGCVVLQPTQARIERDAAGLLSEIGTLLRRAAA